MPAPSLPHLPPTARRLAFATLALAASTLSACVSTHPVRVLPKGDADIFFTIPVRPYKYTEQQIIGGIPYPEQRDGVTFSGAVGMLYGITSRVTVGGQIDLTQLLGGGGGDCDCGGGGSGGTVSGDFVVAGRLMAQRGFIPELTASGNYYFGALPEPIGYPDTRERAFSGGLTASWLLNPASKTKYGYLGIALAPNPIGDGEVRSPVIGVRIGHLQIERRSFTPVGFSDPWITGSTAYQISFHARPAGAEERASARSTAPPTPGSPPGPPRRYRR